MTRIIETTVYSFNELDDDAKEVARDWLRGCPNGDDFEHVIDDAVTIAEMIGIDIDTKSQPLMNGETRQKPVVYWSGFSSQGDGASFTGSYSYKKGSVKAVKEYVPLDTKLHDIVKSLYDVQRRYFYSIHSSIKQGGHYVHSGTMQVDSEYIHNEYSELNENDYDAIEQSLRDFADWIYDRLDAENDYMNSNEYIDDMILANEYEFNENGTIFT